MGEISQAVPNLLERDFHSDAPNQKWVTDLCEFQIPAGKVFLLPIVDCFDGMVVSWSIGTSANAELVNSMLDNAVTCLKRGERPIIHSDRGYHYRWSGRISRMNESGLTRSMSRKGCSPYNAACEGFFGLVKTECSTHGPGMMLLWLSSFKSLMHISDGGTKIGSRWFRAQEAHLATDRV
jgi:putative transposase